MIRLDMKEIQYLVEHLTMLCRNSHHRLNHVWMLLQFKHNGRHLDGFRTRAEHSHDLDFFLFHYKPLLIQC